MAIWRPALSAGVPWIESTGTLASRLRVAQIGSPTTAVTGGTTLAYALYDATGALVLSQASVGVSSDYTNTFVTAVAITSDLDPTKVYAEVWTGSLFDAIGGSVRREAYPSRYPMRDPPITTIDVLARHPTMSTYPPGQTDWEPQIASAWFVVCEDYLRHRPAGSVWTPTRLAPPCLNKALAVIFRQAATYTGGTTWLEQARDYDRIYAEWWPGARLGIDTDSDGDLDTISARPGGDLGPAQSMGTQ